MTDVYEGSLIRVFRRLEELIRQMAVASKDMGSEELEQKFETALTKVKRGWFLPFPIIYYVHTDDLSTCRYRCCSITILVIILLCLSSLKHLLVSFFYCLDLGNISFDVLLFILDVAM